MNTRRPLLVPDALQDEDWKSNPDIKLGMISYLGVPISWPDGEIFGTICVLDRQSNGYSDPYLKLLLQWRDVLQADLTSIATSEERFRTMQAELAHANRLATLGQLTASITHEVKQPLTAALLNAHAAQRFLARQPADVEGGKKAVDRAVQDCIRAAEVVDQTRALVRKEVDRKDSVEINEATAEVIGLIRNELLKNGVEVQTQLAEGLPVIQGSRVQLQQVMLNLIVNAIEAMSQTGDDRRDLLISTHAQADCILIAVRDSGPGLPEGAIERAFEAFYTTKSSGLGMGLSICRSIIEDHGGRLWAAANEPNGAAVIQAPKPEPRIMRYELTDYEWAAIKPLLPNKPRGVPRVNDRRVLNGIFLGPAIGAPWRDLPDNFGPYTTCYNRFVRWRRAGVWAGIMNALAAAHDAAVQMIDTSIVRVHQHAACIARNKRQSMGRSRGGLTSKIHAVVDTNGLPVRLALTAGEAHDNRLAGKLLSR
jgi:signal transduction histidine kinase/transposase